MKQTFILLTLLTCLALIGSAQEAIRYQIPPREIFEMVDAPGTPMISFSPDGTVCLILDRAEIPTIEDIAAPEARLAGVRINPDNFGPSRANYFIGMSVLPMGAKDPIKVTGLPEDARIRNLRWSSSGKFAAFTNDKSDRIELWIADIAQRKAWKLSHRAVNDVIVNAFSWLEANKSLVFASVGSDPKDRPLPVRKPTGPEVQESMGRQAAVRTFQDLLKNPQDAALFEYFIKTQLVVVDITSGQETLLGPAGLYSRFTPSPDARFLLVQELQKPFSFAVPYQRFAINISIWNQKGDQVKSLAKLPLAEELPQGNGSVRKGPRSITWQNDAPATLWWVEALDDGDPAKKVDFRDQLFRLEAPFADEPQKGPKTALRFAGFTWGNQNLAVIYQNWWQTRRGIASFFNPSNLAEAPKVLFDRSTEDLYGNPGSFYTASNPSGQDVLLMDAKQKYLYLTGAGNSPQGSFPFLDRFEIATMKTTRLWQCKAPYFESVSNILSTEPMRFITRRESVDEQPNYYIRDLKKNTIQAFTNFPDPFPRLRELQKQVVHYTRNDGVALNGELFLPPGYKTSDGPLPTLLWAYPREFKSADNAGQVTGSPYTFTRMGASSVVMLATQGYAVLNNASFPIVGEGEAEPNDTFIPQLVENARAAINKLVEMGVTDPKKVAVSGHSYGAFMTANLLTHCDLFAAGVARSGAYNRTLTPFGFQSEDRTYWQAPDLYNAMSPFSYADKMKHPLLLIHGSDDNNAGTFPIQSERYFQALRGHGAKARLVMLPNESHGYSARESILHMHWETLRWLDKYLKGK